MAEKIPAVYVEGPDATDSQRTALSDLRDLLRSQDYRVVRPDPLAHSPAEQYAAIRTAVASADIVVPVVDPRLLPGEEVLVVGQVKGDVKRVPLLSDPTTIWVAAEAWCAHKPIVVMVGPVRQLCVPLYHTAVAFAETDRELLSILDQLRPIIDYPALTAVQAQALGEAQAKWKLGHRISPA
jgi:hypothetical protein